VNTYIVELNAMGAWYYLGPSALTSVSGIWWASLQSAQTVTA